MRFALTGLIALGCFGCGSASESPAIRTVEIEPRLAEASTSASASSAEPASSVVPTIDVLVNAPVDPTALVAALTTENKERFEIASSVCQPAILRQDGGVMIGCHTCPPFDKDSNIGGPLVIDPTDRGDFYALEHVYQGSFTLNGKVQAAAIFSGCEPHSGNYGGTLLVDKTPKGWASRSYRSGFHPELCKVMPRPSGPSMLVCSWQTGGQGLVSNIIDAYDFVQGSDKNPEGGHLSIASFDNDTYAHCFGGGGNDETHFAEVKGFDVDLTSPSRPRVVVVVRVGTSKRSAAIDAKCAEVNANLDKPMPPFVDFSSAFSTVQKKLVFEWTGSKFKENPLSPQKLDTYRKKRDASATNEPFGGEGHGEEPVREGETYKGAFVIHQHDATRMHFDLRLEMGGVLASFAVPKGMSLDPEEKHLAVHTEDHPIEYLDFEAVIPAGNYGAGPMIVWDSGFVRYLDTSAEEGTRIGKIHFSLEGKKVRGRFALVRVKSRDKKSEGREWLLFKKEDAFAAKGRNLPEELPRSVLSGLTVVELLDSARIGSEIEERAKKIGRPRGDFDGRKLSPMLCSLGEVPTGKGFLHELKLDGVRIIAVKSERGVELSYRSKRPAHLTYPEVARAVALLPVPSVVLDGEVVAFDERGRPSFDKLAPRIQGDRRVDVRAALTEVPVTYMVFDVLAIGETDLRSAPLSARKALLSRLIRGPGVLRLQDHLESGGDELLAFCRKNGLEGIVSKRADGRYVEGPTRTGDWVKTKCEREASFVVVGYTRGENARARMGAINLATFEDGELVYRGKVGSGLTDSVIDKLLPQLEELKSDVSVARGVFEPAPLGRTFVRGAIVVRVRHLEWTDDHHLRFPVFLHVEEGADIRTAVASPTDEEAWLDKAPADAKDAPASDTEPRASSTDSSSSASGAADGKLAVRPLIEVRITNRAKVFFPEDGYTKGDLIDYYDAVAPTMLRYLVDRPVMLVRYPDGIDGKSFYQWNVPHGCPPWVKSVALGKHMLAPDGDEAHKKHVFLIDRKESLLYLANLACIPVHILASRITSPRESDFLTIDFDVNLASLADAIPQALTLRSILEEVGLLGFPKTSGQSGLHVFVTLGHGVTPEAARMLADLLGRLIVERHPKTATMERIVAKRGPKVYVDTGQTGPSRTIVAPYSVRATKGARVSTPLTWDEVVSDLDPSRFTIKTVPLRIAETGDPYEQLFENRPTMDAVLGKLAALLPGAR